MKTENRFYVYAYLDPRKPGKYIYGDYSFDYEPFYIGKGHGNRKYKHLTEASGNKQSHKLNKIRKIILKNLQPIIVTYEENIFDNDAKILEIKIIKAIGRFDLKLGPLTNLTDGGEGTSGKICSKKTKDKISKSHIGIFHSEKTKDKLRKTRANQIFSKETRKKMSESSIGNNNSFFGKKHSKKSREKMAKSQTGKKQSLETIEKRANLQYKQIINSEGLFFKSQKEAAIYYNINPSYVSNMIIGYKKNKFGLSYL